MKLRRKIFVLLAGAGLLLGCAPLAQGQRMRPPRVYRPGAYNNTRRLMNNRAAARAAIKKRLKAKAKRRRALRPSAG